MEENGKSLPKRMCVHWTFEGGGEKRTGSHAIDLLPSGDDTTWDADAAMAECIVSLLRGYEDQDTERFWECAVRQAIVRTYERLGGPRNAQLLALLAAIIDHNWDMDFDTEYLGKCMFPAIVAAVRKGDVRQAFFDRGKVIEDIARRFAGCGKQGLAPAVKQE